MAHDEIRRSKRIVSVAAGLAVLAVAGFWVTQGEARIARGNPPEEVTLEEPTLADNGMPGMEWPGLHLSLVERMMAHFKLSKAQIEKAQAIVDRYGPRLRELREQAGDDEVLRAEAERLRTERNKRLSEILTPEQRKRLPNFSWRRPPGAFPVI